MKRFLFFLVVALSASAPASAQIVSNVTASLIDDKVVIRYDLSDPNEYNRFFVRCYYSLDDGKSFDKEIATATGAIGNSQSIGTAKVITWDPRKELFNFDGNIKFKIHASVPENYFNGNLLSVQLLQISKANETELAIKGIAFGKSDVTMQLKANSILSDKAGKAYKLIGGSFDGNLFQDEVKFVKGDSHFFELLFSPQKGGFLPFSISLETALLTFEKETVYMPGLNIKTSK